ncbi:MAG: dimethylamine corrinoid protein 3 [Chloroflexota bacterium]|nr:MAG: dimethylamine corrinoid protein 3 [Chloroflexota bacterium]
MSDEFFKRLRAAMVDGEEDEAVACVNEALAAGVDPMKLVKQGVQPGMDDIGKKFESGESFLPELILAGDAAKAALDIIVPQISTDGAEQVTKGTVVIATMFGDNHDIGKNLVSAILSAYGFNIVDVGINASVRAVIEEAEKVGANIIASSTLITTSLPYQRQIIQNLKDSGRREKFFVIVGGGPVTPEWAKEIGADGYGREANDAAMLCQQLMAGDFKPGSLAEPIVLGALDK